MAAKLLWEGNRYVEFPGIRDQTHGKNHTAASISSGETKTCADYGSLALVYFPK